LAALIQVSRTQYTSSEQLGVLSSGTSYWMNYVLKRAKFLGFT